MAKSDQASADAKAARATRKAEAEAQKRHAAEELRNRRNQQLESTRKAIGQIENALRLSRARVADHEALCSHLEGFYQEIDKLAKGKSLFPATDLIVAEANNIIRDAKTIVKGDTYLERVHEFVPAGDNPVYPDVLVSIRFVQQSLKRSVTQSQDEAKSLRTVLSDARTIVSSLECHLRGEAASEEEVQAILNDKPADRWFSGSYGKKYFDFDRLDRCNLDKYLSENDHSGDTQG